VLPSEGDDVTAENSTSLWDHKAVAQPGLAWLRS
jgi:hypothetical protein